MPISYTFSFSLFEKKEVNAGSSGGEELEEHLCICQAGELAEVVKPGKLTFRKSEEQPSPVSPMTS